MSLYKTLEFALVPPSSCLRGVISVIQTSVGMTEIAPPCSPSRREIYRSIEKEDRGEARRFLNRSFLRNDKIL